MDVRRPPTAGALATTAAAARLVRSRQHRRGCQAGGGRGGQGADVAGQARQVALRLRAPSQRLQDHNIACSIRKLLLRWRACRSGHIDAAAGQPAEARGGVKAVHALHGGRRRQQTQLLLGAQLRHAVAGQLCFHPGRGALRRLAAGLLAGRGHHQAPLGAHHLGAALAAGARDQQRGLLGLALAVPDGRRTLAAPHGRGGQAGAQLAVGQRRRRGLQRHDRRCTGRPRPQALLQHRRQRAGRWGRLGGGGLQLGFRRRCCSRRRAAGLSPSHAVGCRMCPLRLLALGCRHGLLRCRHEHQCSSGGLLWLACRRAAGPGLRLHLPAAHLAAGARRQQLLAARQECGALDGSPRWGRQLLAGQAGERRLSGGARLIAGCLVTRCAQRVQAQHCEAAAGAARHQQGG